ncbi:MAG: TraR/DksA C4-type zinc finger protein [Planctomycetota bacterium]
MSSTPRPCARCGEIIPAERAELLPDTRLCVGCSQRSGGEFDLALTPENLSKSGSMKKNYSSFRVEKKRRPVEKE